MNLKPYKKGFNPMLGKYQDGFKHAGPRPSNKNPLGVKDTKNQKKKKLKERFKSNFQRRNKIRLCDSK